MFALLFLSGKDLDDVPGQPQLLLISVKRIISACRGRIVAGYGFQLELLQLKRNVQSQIGPPVEQYHGEHHQQQKRPDAA